MGLRFLVLWRNSHEKNVDEGAAHLIELSDLAKKDPEFYKYLQENDRDLLEFNPDENDLGSYEADEGRDVDMHETQETERAPVLTKKELQQWQKSLLEVFSCSPSNSCDTQYANSIVHFVHGESL